MNSQEFVPGQFTIEGLLAVFCKNLKKTLFLTSFVVQKLIEITKGIFCLNRSKNGRNISYSFLVFPIVFSAFQQQFAIYSQDILEIHRNTFFWQQYFGDIRRKYMYLQPWT